MQRDKYRYFSLFISVNLENGELYLEPYEELIVRHSMQLCSKTLEFGIE